MDKKCITKNDYSLMFLQIRKKIDEEDIKSSFVLRLSGIRNNGSEFKITYVGKGIRLHSIFNLNKSERDKIPKRVIMKFL